MVKKDTQTKPSDAIVAGSESRFPLTRANFRLMIAAAIVIVIGFLLMVGAPSTLQAFNHDIYSTRRIIIGPAVAIIGFALMGFGIIYNPLKNSKEQQ